MLIRKLCQILIQSVREGELRFGKYFAPELRSVLEIIGGEEGREIMKI